MTGVSNPGLSTSEFDRVERCFGKSRGADVVQARPGRDRDQVEVLALPQRPLARLAQDEKPAYEAAKREEEEEEDWGR